MFTSSCGENSDARREGQMIVLKKIDSLLGIPCSPNVLQSITSAGLSKLNIPRTYNIHFKKIVFFVAAKQNKKGENVPDIFFASACRVI